MSNPAFHAVFLHPGALEALGAAITPYLSDGPLGKHVVCREIDSGGPFFGMTIVGTASDGRTVELDLMIPSNMVLMVLSAHGEGAFGFQQGFAAPEAPSGGSTGAAAATPAAAAAPPITGADPFASVEG